MGAPFFLSDTTVLLGYSFVIGECPLAVCCRERASVFSPAVWAVPVSTRRCKAWIDVKLEPAESADHLGS